MCFVLLSLTCVYWIPYFYYIIHVTIQHSYTLYTILYSYINRRPLSTDIWIGCRTTGRTAERYEIYHTVLYTIYTYVYTTLTYMYTSDIIIYIQLYIHIYTYNDIYTYSLICTCTIRFLSSIYQNQKPSIPVVPSAVCLNPKMVCRNPKINSHYKWKKTKKMIKMMINLPFSNILHIHHIILILVLIVMDVVIQIFH